jgi:serine/threonine protein kinase
MGTVFLARDSKLGRRVALKVMKQVDASGELASRMLAEARILATLEHPNIVPVHDVGTLPDGRVFYVMKFVEGVRLDQPSSELGSLSDSLRVFQKICEAVAFAHAHGVLHRDLKPENIMLGSFGEVLIMDWGVAKFIRAGADQGSSACDNVIDRLDAHQTATGTIVGTPAYMAPEQARGEEVDERADVYALGAILHSMLTGRPPNQSGDPDRSEAQTMMLPSSRLPARRQRGLSKRSAGRKVPRQVEAICLKALSADPRYRYAGAGLLAGDVARYLDGLPVSAYRENVLERAGRWIERNRFVTMLVIAYLLMRVILFIFAGR